MHFVHYVQLAYGGRERYKKISMIGGLDHPWPLGEDIVEASDLVLQTS